MIEKTPVKFPVSLQHSRLAFAPSFSHDNQPHRSLRKSDPYKFGSLIESFDSGGNKYV